MGTDPADAALATAIVIGAAVILTLPSFVRVPGAQVVGAAVGLFLVLTLLTALIDGPSAFPAGAGVALGALAASPLVLFLGSALYEDGLGTRVVGLALACADGLVLIAATNAASSVGSTSSAAVRFTAYFDVISSQVQAVLAAVAGGPPGAAPLSTVNDPTFVALSGLALLATLLAVIRPASGRGDPLPASEPWRGAEPAPTVPVSEAFRAVLDDRSRPEPPPPGRLPGWPALLVGLLAGGLMLAVLSVSPGFALFELGVAAVFGAALILLAVRVSAAGIRPSGGAPTHVGPEGAERRGIRSANR